MQFSSVRVLSTLASLWLGGVGATTAHAAPIAYPDFFGEYQLIAQEEGMCAQDLRAYGVDMGDGVPHMRMGAAFFPRINRGPISSSTELEQTDSETVTTENREIIAVTTRTKLDSGERSVHQNYARLSADGRTLSLMATHTYPTFQMRTACTYMRTARRAWY